MLIIVLNIKISLIFSEYSCSSHADPDFIKMHVVELSFLSKMNFQCSVVKQTVEISDPGHQDGHWGLDLTMRFWSKF